MANGVPRVLLVDDDPDDRAVALRMLRSEHAGLAVVEAGDALAFAQALTHGPWDMALVAQVLAWAEGHQVLAALREHFPQCALVLLTEGAQALAGPLLRTPGDAIVYKVSAGWLALPGLLRELVPGVSEVPRPRSVDAAPAPEPAPAAAPPPLPAPEPPPAPGPPPPPEPAPAPAIPQVEHGPAASLDTGTAAPPVLANPLEGERTVDLLDHLVAAGGAPEMGPVNLESALLEAMADLAGPIREAQARVRCGTLPTLRMPRPEARELFRRILTSALGRCVEGQPVLGVTAAARADHCLISVADNGAVPALGALTEFYVSEPAARGYEDLEAARAIARRHGGDLWLSPRAGEGCNTLVLLRAEHTRAVEVKLTVRHAGEEVGEIAVTAPTDRQVVARAALQLPGLRERLGGRPITAVVFATADTVDIVA